MKAPCPRGLRAFLSSLAGFALGFSAATWLFSPWAAQRAGSGGSGVVPTGVHCWWQGGFGRGGALLMGAGRSGASSFSFAFSFPFASSSASREETEWGGVRTRSFVYVGVITAHKYLSTRAWAAYRTWAPTVPGRVDFFTSDGSSTELPLPLVALPGVDDVYPPQKKSFMMLKYMHDHYLDQFEWFVRADDDAYIRGDRLEQFLRRLNSSEPHYLGQTGLGTTEELGKLALEPGENFCMGGPGMVFSREALRRLAPNVGPCLREMHTGHEDVEVGRCVRRFADTQCVWSYEMQQLFYEHYERNKRGYIQDLPASKLHRAITLHPNKRPAYQYRLHSLLLASRAQELRHKTIELHRQILQTATEAQQLLDNGGDDEASTALDVSSEDRRLGASPSFMRFHPRDRQHVLEWDFFTGTHLWSARAGAQGPRQALSGGALRSALDGTIVAQLMEMIDARARARRRAIDFREILYGYARVNPLHGADYVLDVLMTYRRSEGKRAAVPVRRHAYLQQTFGRAEFAEEREMQAAEFAAAVDASAAAAAAAASADGGGIAGGNAGDGSLLAVKLSNSLGLFAPFGRTPVEAVLAAAGPSRERIHMLVPLAGRYKAFVRFMENFERVCLARPQNIKLVLLLFRPSSDDGGGGGGDGDAVGRPEALVEEYRRRYPKVEIEVLSVTGPFSRGLALEVGSSQFPGDALLFFCDVDLAFTADALQRCRDNAGRVDPTTGSANDDGRVGQVYFPVIFSQYDPRIVHSGGGRSPTSDDGDGRHDDDDPFDFSDRAGMWRAFGYGIACLHRADLARAGGFDTSITGWGLEDVDLFGKVVAARAGGGAGGGLAVFRSPDPGVAHLHHEVRCDPALEPRQLRMCRNSKASTLGSARQLAHTWLAHAEAAAVAAAGEDEGGGRGPGRLGPTATDVVGGGDGAASR
ncbi:chondroitin sulfate synthase 1-like [Lethenteron reissneri]|uniref:chondroitin sulfate synthase 1-like n=1 Tax=Lethenteron reissneri TaxID=7753 RepID=UPI002AB6B09C|nr:chondroitin sulfate synthase 1-like [Lethenteron reissneri]